MRERLTERARQLVNRSIHRHAKDASRTFFPESIYPWIPEMERSSPAIRAELDMILEHRASLPSFQDVSVSQRYITNDNKWKTFFLYIYGRKIDENCARCPETTRLIESIPGMKTAMFSILSERKHIPAHEGPYKGVLRYHLGLIVPQPLGSCRIRVGSDFGQWSEGKSLVFDDTFEHEVWNDADAVRVVLFMDIVRPLPFPLSVLNAVMIRMLGASLFTEDIVDNSKKWSRKLEEPKRS